MSETQDAQRDTTAVGMSMTLQYLNAPHKTSTADNHTKPNSKAPNSTNSRAAAHSATHRPGSDMSTHADVSNSSLLRLIPRPNLHSSVQSLFHDVYLGFPDALACRSHHETTCQLRSARRSHPCVPNEQIFDIASKLLASHVSWPKLLPFPDV